MKVNGVDARKYNAKQITVEIQPPAVAVNYEWMTGALHPIEFDTDVMAGHLKLCVYFRGKDRNSIIRKMSEFMANFTKACDLELADESSGQYTEEEIKNAVKSVITTFDYSVDQERLTLTEREYGEQLVLVKE